ncbi:hypothetical protein E4U57_002871 [Claviceps arundinis]|uniref:PSP1 C-terminal domain-containing protein n=1 Tax=Claviceps arundinis TaxID=1623583 RepID=A0A9P7MZ02_9HYPO|nr:hypothetical protein E4U57_002871 [Claviceps arundinis]KAG5976753.1 hypothetical protein E4U56_001424 [Claviceps arundinis]
MSNSLRSATPSRLGPGSLPSGVANNHSLWFGKVAKARTPTPDSDALASSDDEGGRRNSETYRMPPAPAYQPARRSSWLNDTSQPLTRPRKESFASSSMSPTASHPSPPLAEVSSSPWGPISAPSVGVGRSCNSSAFSWGTGIWNTDRKDATSRFSEVLPSPTSTMPSGIGGCSFFGPESLPTQLSPTCRDSSSSNSQIPFAIPLHPTPKTYRSQSYSVGQMDPENGSYAGMSSSAFFGRARHSGLQHRPSRPSMLSEMANDGSMLGNVREVDDDEDDPMPDSMPGFAHQTAESKTIERLTRENAMLRQQQYHSRIRPRASTGASYLGNGYETVPEECDFAVDSLDEANDSIDLLGQRATGRRMSEYGSSMFGTALSTDERKANENLDLKKVALWSSSPAFIPGDNSQSRRHSFANMPTRHGSISSVAESVAALDAGTMGEPRAFPSAIPENMDVQSQNSSATITATTPAAMHSSYRHPYGPHFGLTNQFAKFEVPSPSPPRNVHSMAQQSRHNQPLHVVLFKCARPEVFYVQATSGLTIKAGDLVIVEADRGTDLGTVIKDNLEWQTAKDVKDHFSQEHYNWLMMYSQGAAALESTAPGSVPLSNSLQGSAVGGMGPSQPRVPETNGSELRPKLIKRLAQHHELHSLRDKESQEAKAKRVCVQKVKEHGLDMEILDAEFQMDWKKLTFYYFADKYINFNNLVVDLFKVYKTRIWMSAINPASFASPTLGFQAPNGFGPGAAPLNRAPGAERRQTPRNMDQQPLGRGYRQGIPRQVAGDRGFPTASAFIPATSYTYGTGRFNNNSNNNNNRGNGALYASCLSLGVDSCAGGFGSQSDFQALGRGLGFAGPQDLSNPSRYMTGGVAPSFPAQHDWSAAF